MTTNENTAALSIQLAEADNTIEILMELKPFVPGPVYTSLCLDFDMCPIHDQDLDSCADDDTDNDENEIEGMEPLAACRHLRPRA